MSDTQQTQTDSTTDAGKGEQQEQQQSKTFTQADLDEIAKKVRAEERRKAAEKYADYDELRTKAGQSATVEDRLAAAEQRAQAAEARALRNDIATRFSISAEDRDLFLTGTDEDTLTAQAQRLADRESERKKNSNVVPREGNNPRASTSNVREFTRGLFGESA